MKQKKIEKSKKKWINNSQLLHQSCSFCPYKDKNASRFKKHVATHNLNISQQKSQVPTID